jgi:hypothetical protein
MIRLNDQGVKLGKSAEYKPGHVLCVRPGSRSRLINRYLFIYRDKTQLMTEVAKIPYNSGSTNTSGALWMTHYLGFTAPEGDRANVKDMAIIFVDGTSNRDVHRTIPEALAVRNRGTRILP